MIEKMEPQTTRDDGKALIEFLKRFSPISNEFIDDLFSFYDPDTTQTEPVVDLDAVAKWLHVRKFKLMQTLRASYKTGIDYKVTKMPKPHATSKYGSNAYKQVLLTPDCFKRLCMRSRGRMAEDVRTYFIEIEALVTKYRSQLVAGIREEIRRMEGVSSARKKRAVDAEQPAAGYIYVLRASDQYSSVYKIGRTRDLNRRLREHASSKADPLDVAFTFRTDDVQAVETCIRGWLRDRQWKSGAKYKEVYKADLAMVKTVVHGCDNVGARLKRVHSASCKNASATIGGGGGLPASYFLVVVRDK
jgi:predicted GIY-YIG superfamily endonuclease